MRTRLALVEACLYCSLVRGEDIRVMSAQHAALQSTVASCLTAILGTDQNQRKAAEDELKALEVTEGLNRNRQASGVFVIVAMFLT